MTTLKLKDIFEKQKGSRLRLAKSRDFYDVKWMSTRMKLDKNPEQMARLKKMANARIDKMFTYIGIVDGSRTFRLNQN